MRSSAQVIGSPRSMHAARRARARTSRGAARPGVDLACGSSRSRRATDRSPATRRSARIRAAALRRGRTPRARPARLATRGSRATHRELRPSWERGRATRSSRAGRSPRLSTPTIRRATASGSPCPRAGMHGSRYPHGAMAAWCEVSSSRSRAAPGADPPRWNAPVLPGAHSIAMTGSR